MSRPMKVKELIEKLSEYKQDADIQIFVDVYEVAQPITNSGLSTYCDIDFVEQDLDADNLIIIGLEKQ